MPGDDILEPADVVMDRAFTVPGTPEQVWPWIAQLGKGRGRWYLTRSLERFLPRRSRGLRHVEPRWQHLAVADVVPDYGRDETFTVRAVDPPRELVYYSERGHVAVTWAITLSGAQPHAGEPGGSRPSPDGRRPGRPATRVRLRLRLLGIRRRWLAETAGELIDLLTTAGMAAGLRERLADEVPDHGPPPPAGRGRP